MSRALAAARYFVHLSWHEPEPDPLTPGRLQKLLYYLQGRYLSQREEPFFDEPIEAWPDGPVVRAAHDAFAAYSGSVIPAHEAADATSLPPIDAGFVASVWGHHRYYSASELWRMVHTNGPWKAIRDQCPTDAEGGDEIPRNLIESFFIEEFNRHARPGFGIEKVRRMTRDESEGRSRPLHEILAELGMEDELRAAFSR